MPKMVGAPEYPALEPIVMFRLWHLENFKRVATKEAQRHQLLYALAELPPAPGPLEVGVWMQRLRAAGVAPGSVNNYRRYLSRAYEVNRQQGAPLANPVLLTDPFEIDETPRGEALGGHDSAVNFYERARVVLTGDGEREFLALLRFVGLARGELLGLEPKDFTVTKTELTLFVSKQRGPSRSHDTKAPKTRARRRHLPLHVMLPAQELAELRAYLKACPRMVRPTRSNQKTTERVPSRYVFPWHGGDVQRFVEKLRAIAPGLFPEGYALHELRHALLEECEQEFDGHYGKVRDLAGHASEWSSTKYIQRRRGRRLVAKDLGGLAARVAGRVAASAEPQITAEELQRQKVVQRPRNFSKAARRRDVS